LDVLAWVAWEENGASSGMRDAFATKCHDTL